MLLVTMKIEFYKMEILMDNVISRDVIKAIEKTRMHVKGRTKING